MLNIKLDILVINYKVAKATFLYLIKWFKGKFHLIFQVFSQFLRVKKLDKSKIINIFVIYE